MTEQIFTVMEFCGKGDPMFGGKVRLRVWYGRATATGWEPWKDWDGYRFDADLTELKNKRTMPLFK